MKLAQSKVHFIGIGGIGMCGLAELLHNMGAKVTGSDQLENVNLESLRKLGIPVTVGHKPENVGQADVVVYSSAVPKTNVEYVEAKANKIPLIPRAELLAEIMRLKRGIAVGGTHGKTTTTAMAAAIFLQAKVHPTIVVGGRLDLIKSTAYLGQGDWLIAEADESDGSFSKLSPEIAIVTNIDNDHLDHYRKFENLRKAFFEFASRIPFYGLLIACGDDAHARDVYSQFSKRIVFYGFDSSNDVVIRPSGSKFELVRDGQVLGSFSLRVPGRHNVANATAAIIAGLEAGFDFEVCALGLQNFLGVDRRFHFKGSAKQIEVYDDYGHHPTEVRAVLAAFREKYPDRRLIVLFQPHRYSRTQLCWNQFLDCFDLANQVYFWDIYPAGEQPIDGVSSQALVADIQRRLKAVQPSAVLSAKQNGSGPDCFYFADRRTCIERVLSNLQPNDVVVTLGAGDIWKDGMQLLGRLSQYQTVDLTT